MEFTFTTLIASSYYVLQRATYGRRIYPAFIYHGILTNTKHFALREDSP